MQKRIRDEQVQLRILLKSKRACCVCHSPDKAVQIHHIDGNPARTTEDNLAVLCLTHHDQATAGLRKGPVGFGVKLSPQEVSAHKVAWEAAVSAELKAPKKRKPEPERKQVQFLFDFELTKERNQILAARSSKAASERFHYLTQYVIEEFISGIPYRKMLLETFKDIALRGAGDLQVALPLVAGVLKLHPHLGGPKFVSLDGRDRSALLQSLDVLDTVGIYGIEIYKDAEVLTKACSAIKELVEMGSWYKFDLLRRAATKVVRRFERALDALTADERRGMKVSSKRRVVIQTLRQLASADS